MIEMIKMRSDLQIIFRIISNAIVTLKHIARRSRCEITLSHFIINTVSRHIAKNSTKNFTNDILKSRYCLQKYEKQIKAPTSEIVVADAAPAVAKKGTRRKFIIRLITNTTQISFIAFSGFPMLVDVALPSMAAPENVATPGRRKYIGIAAPSILDCPGKHRVIKGLIYTAIARPIIMNKDVPSL